MHKAPTSGGNTTAAADIEANGTSLARHLRAAKKSPMTLKSYMEAIREFDAYLALHGMPRTVAAVPPGARGGVHRGPARAVESGQPPTATGAFRSSPSGWPVFVVG
jgi:hypothetical protein